MWSVGVLWLELLLGTPHVWTLSPRTQAELDRALDAASPDPSLRRTAHL